jgi:hypothetical protein
VIVERAQLVIASVESKFGNRNVFWQSGSCLMMHDDHKKQDAVVQEARAYIIIIIK